MGLWGQVFFAVIMIFGPFHFEDDLPHGLHNECGVLAGSGLRAQHDGVGSFEDGVGHVGDLASVGLHAVDHAFHHLGGDENRFGGMDPFAENLGWAMGNFSTGSSTPRSPRATMTASD